MHFYLLQSLVHNRRWAALRTWIEGWIYTTIFKCEQVTLLTHHSSSSPGSQCFQVNGWTSCVSSVDTSLCLDEKRITHRWRMHCRHLVADLVRSRRMAALHTWMICWNELISVYTLFLLVPSSVNASKLMRGPAVSSADTSSLCFKFWLDEKRITHWRMHCRHLVADLVRNRRMAALHTWMICWNELVVSVYPLFLLVPSSVNASKLMRGPAPSRDFPEGFDTDGSPLGISSNNPTAAFSSFSIRASPWAALLEWKTHPYSFSESPDYSPLVSMG
jgi:hypothetical protein